MHVRQRLRLDHADVPSGQRDQLSDLHMQHWILWRRQNMLAVQDLLAQRRHDWRVQCWKYYRQCGVLVQRGLLRQRSGVLAVHVRQHCRLDVANVPSGQRDQLANLCLQRGVFWGRPDLFAVQDLLAQRHHDRHLQCWECDRQRGVLMQRGLLPQWRDVLCLQDMPCSQRGSHIPVCCWKHCRHSDVRVQRGLLRQRRDVLAVHLRQRLCLDHADMPSGQRDQLSDLHMQRGILRGWQDMLAVQDLLAQRRHDWRLQRWECI